MPRLIQNPGYVDSQLYRSDPVVETVPDRRHHEYDQGMDSSILAQQADFAAFTPNIPTSDQKAALDGNAGLNAGNPVASQGDVAAAVAAAYAIYSFRVATDAPADGEVKINNVTPAAATLVRISNINSNGSNIGNILLKLGENDAIILQSSATAGDLYNYDITGDPVQVGGAGSGGYVELPVAAFDITGTLSDLETTLVLFLFDGNNTQFLKKTSNLSDLNDAPTSRTNLDVYSKSEALAVANNLSDLNDNATARGNLGVFSTTESNANFLAKAANLSDVANAVTARGNLSAQAQATALDDIAALTLLEGDILLVDAGGNVQNLAKGTLGDVLTAGADTVSYVTPSSGVSVTGYIDGLQLSNAADTDHDITIGTGVCRNDADDANYELSVALTKQIDAAWVEGNNLGGMATGVVANNTWYHLWAITKDSDGTEDAVIDISSTGANVPALWTAERRIGSVLTDGSANIIQFVQDGDYFQWVGAISDVSVNNPGTGWDNRILSTPDAFKCLAQVVMVVEDNGSSNGSASIGNPDQTQNASLRVGQWDTTSQILSSFIQVMTNLSSQVMTNVSSSDANVAINLFTRGYIDFRGKR